MPKTKKQKKRTATDAKTAKDDKYTAAFKRGLIARGEAAVPDASGKLPPGATHEITGMTAEGLPKLKRRRFSVS